MGAKQFVDFQKHYRADKMPGGETLALMTQKECFQSVGISAQAIKRNFNKFLERLLDLEFEIYKREEKKCSVEIIKKALEDGILTGSKDFADFFEKNYSAFWELFLSISQSRKTRAGRSFENHLKFLFEKLGYPYDKQTELNGTVDYLIPSEEVFRKNRTVCVLISVKRTLRERWRQVVSELKSTEAGKIYLLTADKDIALEKIKEMRKHNINLVVWDKVKNTKFDNEATVIGFSEFVQTDLPASRKMWERFVK
ncbi:MAG: hypothetical protein Kow0090_21680 [Myxococcota bacterium]